MPPKRKNGPELVRMFPLDGIEPHPLNLDVYRPVTPESVTDLAADIRKRGLLEPIVLTSDFYIISGHRRRVACQVAGLVEVPVRITRHAAEDVLADPSLLTAYNRQRVKTFDEVMREEVIAANPEETYRSLLEHRKWAARVDHLETIALGAVKKRKKISKAKEPMLRAVEAILEALTDYWPLTLRVIHYRLLNDPPLRHASKPDSVYVNDQDSYKNLSDLVARARLIGRIPFGAIHDPTRPVAVWDVHDSVGPFVRQELDGFLKGYARDLLQSQPNHVEIVGEKMTVQSIIREVAMEYTVPYTIGRGYSSLDPRYQMSQRFIRSGKENLVILMMSDYDPEGEDIAESFARSMRDDFKIDGVKAVKVALTAEHVRQYNLPPLNLAKEKSSRRKKFVERHGEHVHELEALHPDVLADIFRGAIESTLDMDLFYQELEREKADSAELDVVRQSVHAFMRSGGNDQKSD